MVGGTGEAIVFLQGVGRGNRTRATMKALPATLHPPSPLRNIRLRFVRLMPMRADKSAVCAINRHLLYCFPPSTPASFPSIVSVTRNARPFGEGLDVGETGGC